MQTLETLKNHGLTINENELDSEDLVSQLGSMDVGDLWAIVEELSGDEAIRIDDNEQVQSLALSYALVDAFENDLDQIGQAEIDAAIQKATESTNKLADNMPEKEDEAETETNETQVEVKTNRKTLVKSLVEENPDALADEIVDMAVEADPDMNTTTAKQYYYNARKELGLKPVGKCGRKPSDTMDRIKALLDGNLDVPKSDMVEKIVSEIGVKEGTASTYYSKAKKQLKQNA